MIRETLIIGCIICGCPLAEGVSPCMFCGHIGTMTTVIPWEEKE